MKCPVDNETLVMTDRSGVEIDYCPRCRGVWLDRGELDKIIERAAAATPAVPAAASPAMPPAGPGHAPEPVWRGRDDDDRRYRDDDDYRRHGKRRRRDSFLGDLFDC